MINLMRSQSWITRKKKRLDKCRQMEGPDVQKKNEWVRQDSMIRFCAKPNSKHNNGSQKWHWLKYARRYGRDILQICMLRSETSSTGIKRLLRRFESWSTKRVQKTFESEIHNIYIINIRFRGVNIFFFFLYHQSKQRMEWQKININITISDSKANCHQAVSW